MSKQNNTPKVLMVGPGRNVMGGISSVVNSYYDLELDKKVKLKYISSMEDGSKIRKLLIAVSSYIRFCGCLKSYDIVHVHMAAQASFSRKSLFIKKAKEAGKKIIIHQHAADFDEFFFKQSDEDKRKCIREIFALADCVIVLSEEWEKFFGRNVCDANKIRVLHNGVVIPEYQKTEYSDSGVLFLGRLGERKGSYDLLKTIPEVLKAVPDAKFYLGGDGDIEQSQRIIDQNSLANHVKLLGWVKSDNKEKYLRECNIFILPSYHEGMPMAVLEAMSYGLATVSTNAGGIPQIIENGIDGFRVEAGDIKAITDVLVKLLTDKELKEKIGQAGKRKIEKCFNAVANVDALFDLYCGL